MIGRLPRCTYNDKRSIVRDRLNLHPGHKWITKRYVYRVAAVGRLCPSGGDTGRICKVNIWQG
jgi:hypothetical protein